MIHTMNKDKMKVEKMAERILNHALGIIYLLTGEEYTIVKKNSPQKNIHRQTGEVPLKCDDVAVYFSVEEWEYIEGHKELYKDAVMENHQKPRTLGISAHKSLGLSDEKHNPVSVSEGGEDERGGKDIQLVEIHSEYEEHRDENVDTISISDEEEEREIQQVEINPDPCTGLRDENVYTVSVIGEELDEKDILQVTIHSDPCAGDANTEIAQNADRIDEPSIRNQLEAQEQNIYANMITDGAMGRNISGLRRNPTRANHFVTRGISVGKTCQKANIVNRNLPCNSSGRTSHQQLNPCVVTDFSEPNMSTNSENVTEYTDTYFKKNTEGSTKMQESHKYDGKHNYNKCGENLLYSQVLTPQSVYSQLLTPQSIHRKEKPFVCSVCDKCFSWKSQLVLHKRCHTGERPFACSYCGSCFNYKASLVRHQRIHTGEKPFVCSDCGKFFSQKSHLDRHQRLHTGEKPFVCYECGKRFSWKSTFVQHQKTHVS